MAREQIGQTIDGWQQLMASLTANAADLPHLAEHATRLAELWRRAQELSTRQAALTASKQEVTKELKTVLEEGRTVANFLRVGVKEKYGRRSEKLVEFRLRPFRGLRRQPETEPPGSEPPVGAPDTPEAKT